MPQAITCTIDGCDRDKIMARGLCSRHYKRWYRYGDATAGQPLRVPRPEMCEVEGCGRKTESLRWCSKHYMRNRRHGSPTAGRDRLPAPGACRVDDCGKVPESRGLCSAHYTRWQKYGDPVGRPAPRPDAVCRVGECGDPVEAQGYCNKHYKRWRRTGSAVRNCPSCGEDLGDVRGTFCSDACTPGWLDGDNRVRRKRGKIPRAIAIPMLVERDGGDCSLCAGPLDFSIAWPDPRSVSIDHVYPVSLGGTNAPENLALAHFSCNLRKSNRVAA